MTGIWRTTETTAWADRDGAGRPPWAPGPATWTVLGTAIAAVLGVVTFTDTLCPEHRAWVQGLGTAAILGSVAALVGVWRGSRWAPTVATLAAAAGVGIGLLDAVHAPGRGAVIAVGFALVAAAAGLLSVRQVALARWEARTVRPLVTPLPPVAPVAEAPAAAEAPVDVTTGG